MVDAFFSSHMLGMSMHVATAGFALTVWVMRDGFLLLDADGIVCQKRLRSMIAHARVPLSGR